MSWDFRKACKAGEHCFSSFFIEFDCEWLNCDKKICHQMQIYSRQVGDMQLTDSSCFGDVVLSIKAAMMDAMVDRCVNKLGREDVEKMVVSLQSEAA